MTSSTKDPTTKVIYDQVLVFKGTQVYFLLNLLICSSDFQENSLNGNFQVLNIV